MLGSGPCVQKENFSWDGEMLHCLGYLLCMGVSVVITKQENKLQATFVKDI